MTWERTYTDEQLLDAIAASTCWRETLRELGLKGTSSGSRASVQKHADRLGADYSHFTYGRKWTEDDLRDAIASSRNWSEVARKLDLSGGSVGPALRGHALRLGIDSSHFGPALEAVVEPRDSPVPSLDNLRTAGGVIAASWFKLCGYLISWPLEPCPYDLIAIKGEEMRRIQVKTTTRMVASSWSVSISTSGRNRHAYDPNDIDEFFIIDGDMNYYLIPIEDVGGMRQLHLRRYRQYIVPQLDPFAEAA